MTLELISIEKHRRLMRAVARATPVEEIDILRKHHRFVHTAEEMTQMQGSWETRMATKYYQRLFKEYALIDLSRYKVPPCR
jgi:hypothetical protein